MKFWQIIRLEYWTTSDKFPWVELIFYLIKGIKWQQDGLICEHYENTTEICQTSSNEHDVAFITALSCCCVIVCLIMDADVLYLWVLYVYFYGKLFHKQHWHSKFIYNIQIINVNTSFIFSSWKVVTKMNRDLHCWFCLVFTPVTTLQSIQAWDWYCNALICVSTSLQSGWVSTPGSIVT